MNENKTIKINRLLSVAPMMDWTDRHCRYFHRLLAPSTLLYTEMVTTGAIIHGDADRFLAYNPEEQPVALQLGGSAPEDLAAVPDDSRISLSWNPVATLIDGSAVDGDITYQVMRSQGGKEFEVLGASVSQPGFIDGKVINGQKYFYKVQSQLDVQGNVVNGGMSEVATASPIDKTPPPPPSGLRAVHTGSAIKVFWDQSSDPAVAGYRVYRRAADKKKPELIGEVKAAFTLFVDSEPPKDTRVFYSITAIDQSTPVNESDFSREATIR